MESVKLVNVTEVLATRALCTQVKEHPFYTRAIFGELGGRAIQEDHPLSRLVQFLEGYEKQNLFHKYDQTTQGIRRALGWQQPGCSNLSPEDASKLQAIDSGVLIQKDAWDKLCSLFTLYRLIDVFAAYNNLSGAPSIAHEFTVNEHKQKSLTEDLVQNIRGWERLRKWPQILSQARNAIQSLQSISQDTTPDSARDNPHIGHLTSLSRRSVGQRYDHLLDNFQTAAMHLSYMMKMPGKSYDGTLPDIPDQLDDLLNIQHDSTVPKSTLSSPDLMAKDKEATSFLAGTSALHLRLPLQLTLALTPLYLLLLFPLHKAKCDRSSLLKATAALGNVRPPVLHEIEKEILVTLLRISMKPTELKAELTRLVSSARWRELENLPATDPAFHFFDPSYTATPLQLIEVVQPDDQTAVQLTGSILPTADTTGLHAEEIEGTDHLEVVDAIPHALSESTSQSQAVESMVESSQSCEIARAGDFRGVRRLQDIENDDDGIDKEPVKIATVSNDDTEQGQDNGEGEEEDVTMEVEVAVANAGDEEEVEVDELMLMDKGGNNSRDEDVNMEVEADKADRPKPKRQAKRKRTDRRKIPTTSSEEAIEDEEENREIIDVDLWSPRVVTLDVKEQPPKVIGREITVHGPTGEISRFKPIVHDKKTLDIIADLWTQVEAAYENGKPLHISNPKHSAFHVVTQEKQAAMTYDDWLDLVRTQNVIVLGGANDGCSFKRALRDLGAPNTVMTIQDESIPAHNNYNERCTEGTFSQIFEASQSPSGKVLNVLDIGLPAWGLKDTGYASNVSALKVTRGQWKTTKALPMEDVNWALAATAGAFHTWHIDCNGFMTFVSPICGEKLWIIGRPHVSIDFEDFADSSLFLGGFDLDRANQDLWTLEAMLLKPGDTLIIRPNTPQAVYTPSASVVHGGYCYASSTLQDSLVGISHAFMAGSFITNTNRSSARFHLQQMIAFYHLALVEDGLDIDGKWSHVPDCHTRRGFGDLMAICMFGILINVLDFATYQYPGQIGGVLTKSQQSEMINLDVNMLSEEERKGCTYTRGQSLQIMDVIASSFRMSESDDRSRWQDLETYQEHMIVSQCQMLFNYKSRAVQSGTEGATGCDIILFKEQLSGVLDGEINMKIRKKLQTVTLDRDMQLPELHLGLEAIDPQPTYTIGDPMLLGMSVRDRLYSEGRRIKSELLDSEFGPIPRKRQKSQ